MARHLFPGFHDNVPIAGHARALIEPAYVASQLEYSLSRCCRVGGLPSGSHALCGGGYRDCALRDPARCEVSNHFRDKSAQQRSLVSCDVHVRDCNLRRQATDHLHRACISRQGGRTLRDACTDQSFGEISGRLCRLPQVAIESLASARLSIVFRRTATEE